MPRMSDSLIVTLLVFAAELAAFIFCLVRARQPIDPLKPRLIPYNLVMIFLAVAMFATAAHAISLITGHQVMPRRGKIR